MYKIYNFGVRQILNETQVIVSNESNNKKSLRYYILHYYILKKLWTPFSKRVWIAFVKPYNRVSWAKTIVGKSFLTNVV